MTEIASTLDVITAKEALWGAIGLVCATIGVLSQLMSKLKKADEEKQESNLKSLKDSIDNRFKVFELTLELTLDKKFDDAKESIKKEIHQELDAKHKHTIKNIKNAYSSIEDLISSEKQEIKEEGSKILRLIKKDE